MVTVSSSVVSGGHRRSGACRAKTASRAGNGTWSFFGFRRRHMRRAARHARERTVLGTIAGTSFSPSRPDGMGRKGPVSVQSAWVYPRRRHRTARRPARVRWPICRRPSSWNAGASSRASRRPFCSTHAVRCWRCSSRARLSRPSNHRSPPGMIAGAAVARRADPPSRHRAAHRLIAGGIRQRSESPSGHNAVALRTRRLNHKVKCDAHSGAGATIVRTRVAHQARVVCARRQIPRAGPLRSRGRRRRSRGR
jgi:hypothetical protein